MYRFRMLILCSYDVQVQTVASAGALGVLVYWDPADAEDNAAFPANTSFIPYASAAIYTTGNAVHVCECVYVCMHVHVCGCMHECVCVCGCLRVCE